MATLEKVLELLENRERIQKAQSGFGARYDDDWRTALYLKLQRNLDAMDAELEEVSGFKEKVVEPFIEGLAEQRPSRALTTTSS